MNFSHSKMDLIRPDAKKLSLRNSRVGVQANAVCVYEVIEKHICASVKIKM